MSIKVRLIIMNFLQFLDVYKRQIDMRRKKITITQQYRPSYMKLNYRENFELITGLGIVCSISIQDKTIFPILDTWSDGLINLTEKDFNEWSTLYPVSYTHLDVYKRQRYGSSLMLWL